MSFPSVATLSEHLRVHPESYTAPGPSVLHRGPAQGQAFTPPFTLPQNPSNDLLEYRRGSGVPFPHFPGGRGASTALFSPQTQPSALSPVQFAHPSLSLASPQSPLSYQSLDTNSYFSGPRALGMNPSQPSIAVFPTTANSLAFPQFSLFAASPTPGSLSSNSIPFAGFNAPFIKMEAPLAGAQQGLPASTAKTRSSSSPNPGSDNFPATYGFDPSPVIFTTYPNHPSLPSPNLHAGIPPIKAETLPLPPPPPPRPADSQVDGQAPKTRKTVSPSSRESEVMERYSFRNLNHSYMVDEVYKCPLCGYTTVQAGNLQQHLYNHEGIKPFKCSLCPYSTAFQSALIRHVKTHSSEMRFKCPHCDYAVHQSYNLRRHMFKKHGATYETKRRGKRRTDLKAEKSAEESSNLQDSNESANEDEAALRDFADTVNNEGLVTNEEKDVSTTPKIEKQ